MIKNNILYVVREYEMRIIQPKKFLVFRNMKYVDIHPYFIIIIVHGFLVFTFGDYL